MATRQAHERQARERAREIEQEYGDKRWPLVPERIAEAAELSIEDMSGFPKNTYGALYKSENTFKIVISAECDTEGQRRFTLCHELGHYFLDGHVEVLFDGGADVHMSDTNHFRSKKHWYEIEADAFAAELLVPTTMARAVLTRARGGLSAVRAIEETFGTSLSCAAVRFANLTRDPVAVILSRGREIEWVSWSTSMQPHAFTRARVKGEWAPPRSVTYALARAPERVLAGEAADGSGLLVEWFDGAPAVQVTEEAVGLGSYGRVLTVLTCSHIPSAEVHHAAIRREITREHDWRDPLRPWAWDRFEDLNDE
jgi:Zn-dependent peptidase ImmA (M78 family)